MLIAIVAHVDYSFVVKRRQRGSQFGMVKHQMIHPELGRVTLVWEFL